MARGTLLFSAVLLFPLAGEAGAANELVLLPAEDLANSAVFSIEGSGNGLEVLQESRGGAANTVSVSIQGDSNGGSPDAMFGPLTARNGLKPGQIVQRGFDNAVSFSVVGSHNLFGAAQTGTGNTITASIVGSGNQASISQTGNGNFVGFSQLGIGNTVSVTQTSW